MPATKDVAATNRPTDEQFELVARAILDGAEIPGLADPEAMSRAIAERILNATSFEDAFSPQQLTAWRTLIGVPVFVRDVRFNRSGFEGQSIYAVCDIEPVDGSPIVTVTCGGKNVLAQLVSMVKHGWQDKPVLMVEKPTQEGFSVLWLEDASNPLDAAAA